MRCSYSAALYYSLPTLQNYLLILFKLKKMTRKLLLSLMLCCIASLSQAQTVHEWYQDGIVIFQMKTDVQFTIPVRDKTVDIERVGFISKLKDTYGIYEMIQMHPNDPDELLRHTYQIKFNDWAKVEALIKDIGRDSRIAYAEKKELHRNFLTPNDLGANTTTGTGMWHLYTMNAQQAWDLSTGDPNIVVAVTDNAILTTHQDLQNKLVQGYDAPTGSNDPNPCGSNDGNHGTHVSGTVGAETDNNIGVSSIGYNVSIMPIKIGNCTGALTHGYEGINYAGNNGADVVNMSWGGGGFSNYGQNVCNAAFNQGTILVAAAGNNNASQQFYPAAYNNVVAVASTTTNDSKSSFSQFGTWISVAAPGSAIRSTYATSNTGYSRIQGTSMASPNVAGLLGLMKSYSPSASNQDLINCLLSTADNIDASNSNYLGQLGSGRINAFAALQCIGLFNLALDVGITEIIEPGPTVCGGSFTPQVRLRNFGTDPLTSVEINYDWNGTPGLLNWTGNLSQGQSAIVSLPGQTASTGNYTFTASTSNPNSGTDLSTGNDAFSQSFVVDLNGQTVDLSLVLDCYGSEISWTIDDDLGNPVFSGGGYADNASGETVNASFCLPAGCYTFNITDTYGDGMYGSQWQTCSVNGDYTITDGGGNVLVQMSAPDADFGFGTSDPFCIIPPTILNDGGIADIITPNGINCSSTITPEVAIRNYGNNDLTSADINYQTSGGLQTFAWTGNLATGQIENVTLPAIPTAGGIVNLTAYTSNPNGTSDDDPSNDQDVAQVNVFITPATLPFIEDFETNVFTSGEWTIENPDNDITWDLVTVGGITPGSTAAKIDFFSYSTAAQRDAMISPLISLVGYTSAEMDFDHAYRRFNQNAADSLLIYISADCGQTWDPVFAGAEDGTGSFATQTTNTTAFTPAVAADWCFSGTVGASCFTIDLTPYVQQEILVKFESYNAGTIGNNLFIDNINIDGVPNNLPPVPDYALSSSTVCEGGTISFTDVSTAGITNRNWSFPGGVPTTSTLANPVITYPTAGNYDVTLTVTNMNGTETLTTTNAINVITPPTTPVITQTGNNLSVVLQPGETANWTYNGSNAGVGATITMTGSGSYSVVVTNGPNCNATATNSFELDVTSVGELAWENSITIYPNPTNGAFTIDFTANSAVQVWIMDALGRKITEARSFNEGAHSEDIDLTAYKPGVYFIQFESTSGKHVRKITKR
jgi:subtilisin family serine protease/PKD repeat protein